MEDFQSLEILVKDIVKFVIVPSVSISILAAGIKFGIEKLGDKIQRSKIQRYRRQEKIENISSYEDGQLYFPEMKDYM